MESEGSGGERRFNVPIWPGGRGAERPGAGGEKWPDLSGYHYVEGEGFAIVLSVPPPFPLPLHFSLRAKVRWPGEPWKVKGNAGRAQGRRLSLAMRLDPLTYNLKFSAPSFFVLFFVMHRLALSPLPDRARIDETSPPEFWWVRCLRILAEG